MLFSPEKWHSRAWLSRNVETHSRWVFGEPYIAAK